MFVGISAITEAAAIIANATREGPRGPNGKFLWYGVDYQSGLTGSPNPTGVRGCAKVADAWQTRLYSMEKLSYARVEFTYV